MLLRLMSHNVWNRDTNTPEWEKLGYDCSASVRVKGILRVYEETMPDVVGMQEMTNLMVDYIKEYFSQKGKKYAVIWGRFTPIMYNSDKLELIDTEFGSYPEKIENWEGEFNDVKSKAWNLAVFRIKENGKIFAFATTHLWWMRNPTTEADVNKHGYQPLSNEAREWQIKLLISKLKTYSQKHKCPMVLTGDFNTPYNSKPIKYALNDGFIHAHDLATDYVDETMGYHYCFCDGFKTEYYDKPFEDAIDHILVKNAPEKSVKRFERYSPNYYYPISDHSPAFIDIEI